MSHRVPLSNQAFLLLMEIIRESGDSHWVFPSPKNPEKHIDHIQKAVQRARSEANLDCVAHDFRRTVASHMASLGVPRLVISKVLNHSEGGITRIYDRHSYDSEKREALQKWADCLEKILADQPVVASVNFSSQTPLDKTVPNSSQ